MPYFLKYGNISVCDNDITSVIVTNNYIVLLETLTESNVTIYVHFEFETRNKELKESRMLKRISAKNEINNILNQIDNIL